MSPRSRTPLLVGLVVAVVAVAAVLAVVLSGGGDGDDGVAGSDAITYGVVTVEGDALPPGEYPDDPSVGSAVPTIRGTDYTGAEVSIAPGEDGPLMIVVMAHWCPHCNAEVPLLLDWKESGDVPDGLRVVGVSTAAADGREHFPPSAWLDELGWDWPVIADDEDQSAAAALGTTGYPFLMFVDADGNLMFRISAELPIADVQTLADAAVATAA